MICFKLWAATMCVKSLSWFQASDRLERAGLTESHSATLPKLHMVAAAVAKM